MSEAIRVLVVEDDPVQRELLISFLEGSHDITVCGGAGDGRTGLELARELKPDLILLDLFLPNLSGMALLHHYRRGGGKAKVLVVTKASGEEVSDGAMAAGADFFLVKPVSCPDLVEDIRFLCDGPRRRCEEILLEMGEREGTVGLEYAARGGALMATRKIRQMKEVYIQIAIENGTSYQCVEKNIRMLVKRVKKLDSQAYRRVTGRTGADERPPHNEDFLRALGQAVKIPL